MTRERISAVNEIQAVCRSSQIVFRKCEGSFIDRINFQSEYDNDQFDVHLTQVAELGEVHISLRQIRYLRLDKPPEISGSFVDEIRATYLPDDGKWPAEAEKMVIRFKGLPGLIWFKVIGPTGINAICDSMSFRIPDSLEINDSYT